MMYPLEAPNGWFLALAEHRHDQEGVHYVPASYADNGAWFVSFQRTTTPLVVVKGTGNSLEQAWQAATKSAEQFENDGT